MGSGKRFATLSLLLGVILARDLCVAHFLFWARTIFEASNELPSQRRDDAGAESECAVRRSGNGPSKSPRTMNPTVSRRSNLRGDDIPASIRRIEARVDGMVSVSKPLKVSSSSKGPKVLS